MTSDGMPRLGFVGAGRLARALAPALACAGYRVTAVAGPRLERARELADGLDGCRAAASAQEAAGACDLLFLAVPDDAIEQVAAGIRWRPDLAAVHCSGALGLEPLRPAVEQGAAAGCFHPLQTFTGGPADLSGVTVAIEAEGRLVEILERMAAGLGCRPLRLPAGARPLYHASAALAANYLVTLLAEAARLWAPLGCAEAQALGALLPLVKTTIANVERLGASAALTGPIARGDGGTVERHLAALRTSAPDLAPLYRELGRATLRLARPQPEQAARLAAILSPDKETEPCV